MTNKCHNNPSECNGHTTHLHGELRFKGTFGFASGVNGGSVILYETLTPGYAMLMRPKQDETAVHGCHSTGTLLCACVKVRLDRGDV